MRDLKYLFGLSIKTIKRTKAITPEIKSKNGIHSLETIKVGGLKQHILIRGKDINNPILLFLHGGPGCSAMGLFRHFNSALENHFIVVNWDQRGTCKSYDKEMKKKCMNLKHFIKDTEELIKKLCKRFKKKKIYLVGHSWGSAIGMHVARKYPKLLYSYVGVSQVVDMKKAEEICDDFLIKEAIKRKNKNALEEIENVRWITPKMGEKYYLNRVDMERKWIYKFGGALHGETNLERLSKVLINAVEYTIFDLIDFIRGSEYSVKCLWRDIIKINLFKQIKKVKIPVYFIQGRHDLQTPLSLMEEYFTILKAPQKKLFIFNKSAHNPLWEETKKFNRIIVCILKGKV